MQWLFLQRMARAVALPIFFGVSATDAVTVRACVSQTSYYLLQATENLKYLFSRKYWRLI